jgi:hypothetical protein
MKRLFLILTITASSIAAVMGQVAGFPCDITSTGVELRNSTGTTIISNIAVSGTGIVRLKIVNAGSAIGTCSYLPGEVKVKAYFPAPSSASYFYKYDGATTFSSTKYNWTYDPLSSVLEGVNSTAIVAGFGGFETVDIPILGVAQGNFLLGIEAEIFASASGDDTNNNTWDVNVNVLQPISLPLTITDFTGFTTNCDATIKWATSFERNTSRFEVEQSSNGVTFTKVGTVQATNAANGNSYQFNYTQGSGNYYYRLKMIDKDESFIYSKIINLQSSCNGKKLVKLYPNPVITNQLLNVNISGYDKAIKADLFTVTGQLVRSFNLKNGNNTLAMEKIAQGTYTLKISENGITTEVFKVAVMQ